MISRERLEIIRKILIDKKEYIDEHLKNAKYKTIDEVLFRLLNIVDLRDLSYEQSIALEILLSLIGDDKNDSKNDRLL